jgi:CHAD domain-containing protein
MRRLMHIETSTNDARDLEVQYGWLVKETKPTMDVTGNAYAQLIRRMRRRNRDTRRMLRATVLPEVRRVSARLTSALERYHATLGMDGSSLDPTMAAATARAMTGYAAVLRKRVSRIRSSQDILRLHSARLTIKHLRYVLEPFETTLAAAEHALNQLESLQDVLGELRDASLLETQVEQSIQKPANGVVSTHLRERTDAARHAFETLQREGAIDRALSAIHAVIEDLRRVDVSP